MPLLPYSLEGSTLGDLHGLVAGSAREDQPLDFKLTLGDLEGKHGEAAEKNLLGDIAAFANIGGGNIVLGVDEVAAISSTPSPEQKSLRRWIIRP